MAWDRSAEDDPSASPRNQVPDRLGPIGGGAPVSEGSPVSGHRAAGDGPVGPSQAPEHDWGAAEALLFPILRPAGTSGMRLDAVDPGRLASEGMKRHAQPILDEGPCGLLVGYLLQAGAFDVHVNADHLLAWGADPDQVRAAALTNLARWSGTAPWTDEVSGDRRLVSSATGDGHDAARILLPEVKSRLATSFPGDVRVLVGIPETDLLMIGGLSEDDPEFGDLFAQFVRGQADDADHPLDRRVLELVGGELHTYAP